MRTDNIFQTGGEVVGDSVIGYQHYADKIKQVIKDRVHSNGGIYIYGLPRTGKTSLIKRIASDFSKNESNVIYLYIDVNKYNAAEIENSYYDMLESIIRKLKKSLKTVSSSEFDLVFDSINDFEKDTKGTSMFREDFETVFSSLKDVGISLLLVMDEFDAASTVFKGKSDFELFRSLTAENDYSVCLITVSRQELSKIEHTNPNNSSFKGVMYPVNISGFNDDDISDYQLKIKNWYDIELTSEMIDSLKFYCGASPYLWSCFGYEMARTKIEGNSISSIEDLYSNTELISTIMGYHDSIFKCLDSDKDSNGNSYFDKLAGLIIGPSFFVTNEDIINLKRINYLTEKEGKLYPVSQAFKDYLMTRTYNNNILNNFETLEKKLKVLLDSEKANLMNICLTTSMDPDQQWFDILRQPWGNYFEVLKSKDIRQINSTYRKFGRTVTELDVMSLETVCRIIVFYWSVFSNHFNNDSIDKWEEKLLKCGEARNPVHHGSTTKVYSPEEQIQINSYCSEIIKELCRI